MAQFAPPSPTDICNLALFEIGQQPIDDIDQTYGNAAKFVRAAFWPSVTEVARSHNWNCLKKRLNLAQLVLPQSSSSGCTSIGWNSDGPSTQPPYWTASTAYLGGDLVTWGQAIYYCLQANTSSGDFVADVTAGLWAQLYSSFICNPAGNTGGNYEWDFAYALPPDFILVDELNGVQCYNQFWAAGQRGVGSLYELFISQTTNSDDSVSNARALFCNDAYADLKYIALIQDTTMWDPMFINAVAVLLASKVATVIRGDDGVMAERLQAKFQNSVLPRAKIKDAGERLPYRYDPTANSDMIRSRRWSTNG